MNRIQKKSEIATIQERFGKAASAVFTDFRGLDVETINKLRREFDKFEGIEYKVVKNTLVKLALEKEEYVKTLPSTCANRQLSLGPTRIR